MLGLAFAVPVLTSDAPVEERPAGATVEDASSKARQPAWVALLNPLVAAAGILIGARLRRENEG